jgi:SAM-dependent methyltransferase
LPVRLLARSPGTHSRADPPPPQYTHPHTHTRALFLCADESFDVVFDKGALDALMAEDTDAVHTQAAKMLAEISRVLKPGGVYVCVTMAQDFIIQRLLDTYLLGGGWAVDVHCVTRTEADASPLTPFLLAIRKTSGTPAGAVRLVFDEELRMKWPQVRHLLFACGCCAVGMRFYLSSGLLVSGVWCLVSGV